MSRSSVISHPPLMPMVIIRAEYRAICGEDDNTAIVLNYFEHLTNAKLAIGDDPWIYKSIREMEYELLHCVSGNTIRIAVDNLVEWGYLNQRRNPRSNIDKTWQYRLDVQLVQKHINGFFKFIMDNSPITQFCGVDCSKLRKGLLKIEEAIPETTSTRITTKKKKDSVATQRARNPLFDAIVQHVWCVDLADTDAVQGISKRVGMVAGKIKNRATPEQIPLFVQWYKNQFPTGHIPYDAGKFLTHWLNFEKESQPATNSYSSAAANGNGAAHPYTQLNPDPLD